MSVPNIAVLRERAATIIVRASSGQMRAMLAGICAAKNTGDPLPADSTGQELITQCQGIIDQAESDALAIFVREFMEFVENATIGGSSGPPVFEGPNPGSGTEAASYSGQIIVSGTMPITYTKDSGTLPTGTTLNANTGLISGTATTAGDYSFTIRATNSAGTATQEFSIGIAGRVPSVAWPVPGVAPAETVPVNSEMFCSLSNDVLGSTDGLWTGTTSTFLPIGLYASSSPGTSPVVYSITGTLPTGMTYNTVTGAFIGSPTDPAQYLFEFTVILTATNDYGTQSLKFKLQIQL